MRWFSGDFLPHSICLSVDPLLIWLYAVSDTITAMAYFSIPTVLLIFLRLRKDISFRWSLVLFGLFVLACGTTHLLELITLWTPVYWIEGIAKAFTAIVSMSTAIVMWQLLPKALALPSPAQLQREIDERKLVEKELRDLAATLEDRVKEQTTEVIAEKERVLHHAAQTRQAEARHAEIESRFRAAQEVSLDGFVIYEPITEKGKTVDLRVLYANAIAARDCHTTAEAMQGQLIGELLPGTRAPGGMIETFSRVATTGTPLDFVLEYNADGITGAFQNLVVTFDGLIAATFRNVTAPVEAKKAMEKAKAAAERANEAKSRFLAAASHDLRQPLQALSLYIGVLGQKIPRDASPIMGHMDVCIASLNELLSDILDLSKLEAGGVEPRIEDFPVLQVLDKMVAGYAGAASEKGLRLRMVPSRLHIRTDPAMFERIATNLLSNAVRYTLAGGIVFGCRHRAGRIWLEVSDTGIGIPEDKKEVIFEEFRQLANPERNDAKGSGLGLAIVQKQAQLLGLKIRVSSRLGRGTTFAVELPVSDSPQSNAEPADALPITRRLLVALVEDNTAVRKALTLALEQDGHQVVEAASCSELMRDLQNQAPDVVISDFQLAEELTGLDAIASIRAVYGAHIPALIVTGETGLQIVQEISQIGLRILHKPIQFAEIQRFLADIEKNTQT